MAIIILHHWLQHFGENRRICSKLNFRTNNPKAPTICLRLWSSLALYHHWFLRLHYILRFACHKPLLSFGPTKMIKVTHQAHKWYTLLFPIMFSDLSVGKLLSIARRPSSSAVDSTLRSLVGKRAPVLTSSFLSWFTESRPAIGARPDWLNKKETNPPMIRLFGLKTCSPPAQLWYQALWSPYECF